MGEPSQNQRIMVVGNCAAGKSTLSRALRDLGYDAKGFAQEHSYSARVWRRREPHVLILLQCSLDTIRTRRNIRWGEVEYQQQLEILADARAHADLVIHTDDLTPDELITTAQQFLQKRRIPADGIDNA